MFFRDGDDDDDQATSNQDESLVIPGDEELADDIGTQIGETEADQDTAL